MTVEYKQFQVTLVTQELFRIGALQDVMSSIDNLVATVGGFKSKGCSKVSITVKEV